MSRSPHERLTDVPILTVKANHPNLVRRLRALPWKDVPVGDRTHSKGHGRVE